MICSSVNLLRFLSVSFAGKQTNLKVRTFLGSRSSGNDRLTGHAEADTFVFGADARDRNRDSDTIADFDAGDDTIQFEAGATIRFVEQRGANLFIQLEGDRDSVTVLNADRGIVATVEFSNDLFLG